MVHGTLRRRKPVAISETASPSQNSEAHRDDGSKAPYEVSQTVSESDTDCIHVPADLCDDLARADAVEERLVLAQHGSKILLAQEIRQLCTSERDYPLAESIQTELTADKEEARRADEYYADERHDQAGRVASTLDGARILAADAVGPVPENDIKGREAHSGDTRRDNPDGVECVRVQGKVARVPVQGR